MDEEIVLKTEENINLNDIKNDSPQTISAAAAVTEELSKVTPILSTTTDPIEGEASMARDLKIHQSTTMPSSVGGNPMKSKRKRRRGKPKGNLKPFRKTNWKYQKPQKYQSCGIVSCNSVGPYNITRTKTQRSNSIVPYNTNKFLMEEHMAEVPSALLTPSGRTRDSSFSVDSDDNYFYSLPEDEEEFLSKEFANVYERARVERLENMNKQQLIEECLQIEDRYSQFDVKQKQKYSNDFLNKIRYLEERVRELNKENSELRRRFENIAGKATTTSSTTTTTITNNNCPGYEESNNCQPEKMCSSDCSEDSESDSSSSSSSSSSGEENLDGSSSIDDCKNSPNQSNDNMVLVNGETDANNLYSRHNGINGHGP